MSEPVNYDVVIIGAGPIGIELAACLSRAGVRYLQLDANQIGHTISWWPRNTTFFSTTERVAIAGMPVPNSHQGRIPGEDLPHVAHYFTDPHVYFRRRVLIVGGKSSAAEAALRCSRRPAWSCAILVRSGGRG